MFSSLSFLSLTSIFILAASVVWLAGIQLSKTTDQIDRYFGLGEVFGGLIFLAIATNLPEIAIIISAALMGHIGIAIGNILGGIAIQTVVLVLLDGVGLGRRGALTYEAASLQLVLEGVLVIMILVIVIMGSQLPATMIYMNIAPGDFFIALVWVAGLWLISRARHHLPWQEKGRAPDTVQPRQLPALHIQSRQRMLMVVLTFAFAALITLMAGAVLEQVSSVLATRIGWSGILFGSTILAAVTALPEISTGLEAIRLRDYTMAVSDIFGGNAFLPVLFLPATFLSGNAVLPRAQNTDIYLAGLGALLTGVYVYGLIFRPRRQYFRLGVDSIIVLLLYILGVAGLFAIAQT